MDLLFSLNLFLLNIRLKNCFKMFHLSKIFLVFLLLYLHLAANIEITTSSSTVDDVIALKGLPGE